MKHIPSFDEFLNESTKNGEELNEMPMNRRYMGSSRGYSVLSIGALNIDTGKCKYFNVYDEYDGTAEIYKDSTDKFKIVFTAGTKPVSNSDKTAPKKRDAREFKDDQRGTPLFVGFFEESCRVNKLKEVAGRLGIKSCIAYTYK
jgi:hypothetical protein